MRNRLVLALMLLVWLSVVAGGMTAVWSYNHRPSKAASAPVQWPNRSQLQRFPAYTLVMLAHPKCPCTRATLEELSKLMAHTQGRLQTYVLFVKPEGSSPDWTYTDLWYSASAIPGVTVITDVEGHEATRFGAYVSGQALLYDSAGALVFHGGITASRGQVGDNPGRSAIQTQVNEGISERNQTLVFGCPLFDPDSECRKPNHATLNQ